MIVDLLEHPAFEMCHELLDRVSCLIDKGCYRKKVIEYRQMKLHFPLPKHKTIWRFYLIMNRNVRNVAMECPGLPAEWILICQRVQWYLVAECSLDSRHQITPFYLSVD